MVIGKRHRQRIDAKLHQRTEPTRHKQYLQRHGWHDRQRQRHHRQDERKHTDQQRPVVAIRQPAQRPLRQQPGKNTATHVQTDQLGGQALLRGIQRRQTIERAHQQPGPHYGNQRLWHALDEELGVHRRGVQRRRVDASGHGHGHQAQGKAQRHQHEQFKAQLRVDDQNQLPEHQAQIRGNHIQAEHHAALLGVGLLVKPAFDDHVLAHHAQTHDNPEQQPDRQPVG